MSRRQVLLFVACILVLDQATKFYIKTHFELGQEFKVFEWFRIVFIENEGMAWGAKLSDLTSLISDRSAKLILTLFRIVAVIGIGFWLAKTLKSRASNVLVISITLIFSGAIGNIIDSLFYGIIFNESHGQIASLFPSQGYDTLFYGKVVDMLHFPLFNGYFPDWIPFIGGRYFSFFDPVFNIADMAISVGVGLLLLFNKTAFPETPS
jgi:signal peptidase II